MIEKKIFGLIGKNISYSFSENYFSAQFKKLGLTDHGYQNFDIDSLFFFPEIIANQKVKGLNVTIPYKEKIIDFLDELNNEAREIGAVNTIQITVERRLIGYNTDYYGFMKSIKPLLKKHHCKALILGTGGASKAIAFALKKLGIEYVFVSRATGENRITYTSLSQEIIQSYTLIINCTPVGTFPDIDQFPEIPFQYLTEKHLVYDLIYNPEETQLLYKAKINGATVKNGYEMLVLQAEKAWEIWNKKQDI